MSINYPNLESLLKVASEFLNITLEYSKNSQSTVVA